MKNIREIITDLNVARSNSCSQEKNEEIKGIIQNLLPYAEIEEDLGFNLEILGNTFKDGIYYCNAVDSETLKPENIEKVYPYRIDKEQQCVWAIKPLKGKVDPQTGISQCYVIILSFAHYNKKGFCGWALTEEELYAKGD